MPRAAAATTTASSSSSSSSSPHTKPSRPLNPGHAASVAPGGTLHPAFAGSAASGASWGVLPPSRRKTTAAAAAGPATPGAVLQPFHHHDVVAFPEGRRHSVEAVVYQPASTTAATMPPQRHHQRRSTAGPHLTHFAHSPASPSAAEHDKPPPYSAPNGTTTTTTTTSSVLQPRVAVVLGVPRSWHPWLFAARLLSLGPAIVWGLGSALRLLLWLSLRLLLLAVPDVGVVPGSGGSGDGGGGTQTSVGPDRCGTASGRVVQVSAAAAAGGLLVEAGRGRGDVFPLTETALAVIWCLAAGYLSFFFTDCLMSRWLLRYTPQATLVRLLAISAVNAFVTLHVLSMFGGFQDPRLLLPGWIGIATTLTVCYHMMQRKINIRKETSTSINVFSIASFFSMVALLVHLHMHQPDYPQIPFVILGRKIWEMALAKARTMAAPYREPA